MRRRRGRRIRRTKKPLNEWRDMKNEPSELEMGNRLWSLVHRLPTPAAQVAPISEKAKFGNEKMTIMLTHGESWPLG
jgi:hypothetical protein